MEGTSLNRIVVSRPAGYFTMGTFGDEYIYVPTEREGLDDGYGRRKTHETGFSHCGSTGSLALAACASTSSDTASVASRRCNDIGPSASSASSVSAGVHASWVGWLGHGCYRVARRTDVA
jgi:hypothetical protein